MANDVQNYKCPACGGSLHFDGESGKLICDYCDSRYELSQFEEEKEVDFDGEETAEVEGKGTEFSSDGTWETESQNSKWGSEGENLNVYTCPSCGAELICEETTAATSCPYCGNPAVISSKFEGGLKPDYVIPFKLSKEQAVEALNNHYGGKVLLPKAFKDQNHIREIKGVYVPFWLFDADTDGEMSFSASNTRIYRRGDYRITETDHYRVYREGDMSFVKVPVDGSKKMPDDYMDSIEPFNYNELKRFSAAYLPGFMADKYDVESEDAAERANLRCRNTLEAALASTVIGYETVIPTGGNIRLHKGKVHYALLPVWLLSTKWNDKNYLFAMNGQTGKLVGDLPMDKRSFWTWFLGIGVGVGAVLSLFLSGSLGRWLMGLFM